MTLRTHRSHTRSGFPITPAMCFGILAGLFCTVLLYAGAVQAGILGEEEPFVAQSLATIVFSATNKGYHDPCPT